MKRSLGAKTIAYPTPVYIVGTYDQAGRPNAMAAAWAGICCSRPPCLAVSLRAATYTHGNILARRCYTVSIPSEKYVREADYMGLASGRDEDKFAVTGLTPVRAEYVDAPYVAEFPLVLECKLLHVVEIGLHTQFIGEILDIKADESALDEAGHLDIERVRPFLFAPGNQAYYGIGRYLGKAFSIGRDLLRRASSVDKA
ncbi:MAG: flavin reductase family protein [Chloroflexi bacterium]|nr:flavin reductase family protein [Chloroflexota bacterium]